MNTERKKIKTLGDWSNPFFATPNKNWYWHLALLSYMLLSAYFREISYSPQAAFLLKGIIVVLLLGLFYTNAYWLVPKYLFKRRFLAYALLCVLLAAAIYCALLFIIQVLNPYRLDGLYDTYNKEMSAPFFLFMIFVLLAASAAARLFEQWLCDNRIIAELERSKTSAELEQLKNQINPHFLFNMLNSAHVLVKRDGEKASTVLLGLSDLLRYQLYDSSHQQVLVTADLKFLIDFLTLEQLRRDRFDFEIFQLAKLNGLLVSPLLFVTFVENAVKHSNDACQNTFVDLFFEVSDCELHFKCVNSIPVQQAVHGIGGLGLENIQRRLHLLYPLKHQLIITESSSFFCVHLSLKLDL